MQFTKSLNELLQEFLKNLAEQFLRKFPEQIMMTLNKFLTKYVEVFPQKKKMPE